MNTAHTISCAIPTRANGWGSIPCLVLSIQWNNSSWICRMICRGLRTQAVLIKYANHFFMHIHSFQKQQNSSKIGCIAPSTTSAKSPNISNVVSISMYVTGMCFTSFASSILRLCNCNQPESALSKSNLLAFNKHALFCSALPLLITNGCNPWLRSS